MACPSEEVSLEMGHGEVMCRPSKQSRWWICEERPLGVKNYREDPGPPEGRQEHAWE